MTHHTRTWVASTMWAAMVLIVAGAAWLLVGIAAGLMTGQAITATLLLNLIIVVIVGLWRWLDHRRESPRPWFPRPAESNSWHVLASALPCLLTGFFAGQALAIFCYSIFGSSGFDAGQEAKTEVGLPLSLVLTLVMAPLAEEFFIRGCVYPVLRHKLPVAVSVMLSACFFAMLHGNIVQAMVTIPLGIILALVYEKTGMLWPCVLAHLGFNLVALVTPVAIIGFLANPGSVVCLILLFVLFLAQWVRRIEPL